MIFFNQNVKTLRSKNRLTQTEAGKIFGVGQSTYQKWELDRTPSLEIILKISNYYKISIDNLIRKDLSVSPIDNLAEKSIDERVAELLKIIGEKEVEFRRLKETINKAAELAIQAESERDADKMIAACEILKKTMPEHIYEQLRKEVYKK